MHQQWYVIKVRIGDEEKIAKVLKSEGLNAFIPKMKLMYRKQGESVLKKKIMFPGYLFIECELSQIELGLFLSQIHEKIPRFLKLLKVDKEGTSALYPDEIVYLKSLLNDKLVMDHSIGIIEGDRTVITEGPLKGLENRIIKIDRHKRRAIIEVMLCNVLTQVKVSLEIISKTKAE